MVAFQIINIKFNQEESRINSYIITKYLINFPLNYHITQLIILYPRLYRNNNISQMFIHNESQTYNLE